MFETRVNPDPIVGNWYRRLDNYDEFVVVAIDEDSGNIEVQFFSGDVTEITPDEWEAFDLEVIAEPEDWSGALEPVDDSEESEPSSNQPARAEYEEEDMLRMEDEAERETRPTDEL